MGWSWPGRSWEPQAAAAWAIEEEPHHGFEDLLMPPQLAAAVSIWRRVAESRAEIVARGLPFLRNKAGQYHLI
ncbi:hypothetical protein [Labrys neptuniae]